MSLTRHPKDPKLWIARIYPDGRPKDPKTGKPTNKGRERFYFEGEEPAARDWYAALLRGPRKLKVVPLAPTIEQAWPDFCRYYKNHTSSKTYTDFLLFWARHLQPFFGRFRPQQLNPDLIESYKTKRLSDKYLPGKPGQRPEDDSEEETKKRRPIGKRTVQKEINYLKAMVRWMVETNKCAPLPFKIKNFTDKQVQSAPKVIPDRHSVVRFLRSFSKKPKSEKSREKNDRLYRSIFAVAYYGGFRRDEVLELKGEQVDLDHGFIYVKGKHDKVRTVPIHGKMAVWLRNRPRKGFLWLNPDTGKPFDEVKKAVKRGAKRTGYPPDRLHIHVLRDAFGVHALQSGISLRAIQLAYGHASIKTTERYLTLTPQHLADEFNNFGRASRKQPRKKQKNAHDT